MKYIHLYEKNYKERQDEIERSKKIKNFIPGSFMIYTDNYYDYISKPVGERFRDVRLLILGKIESVQKSPLTIDGKPDKDSYALIETINIITEFPIMFIKNNDIEVGKKRAKLIESWNHPILYKTNSLKDAKDKYNELLEQSPYNEWLFNNDTDKYNL